MLEGKMSGSNCFEKIILVARPAAGKSEIIAYLKALPLTERIEEFHINQIEEIDDFPMLWTWFEEDEILETMGYPRLHSDKDGYFLGNHLWHVLIRRMCLEYDKKRRDNPDYHSNITSLIEFSRGGQHGGYRTAFNNLTPQVLYNSAVLYVNVSWSESLRKNRKRFNPNKPDSILEHSLPDKKLEFMYKDDDWHELAPQSEGFLKINDLDIPYVVFENEDDVTSAGGALLGERLKSVISQLWDLDTRL